MCTGVLIIVTGKLRLLIRQLEWDMTLKKFNWKIRLNQVNQSWHLSLCVHVPFGLGGSYFKANTNSRTQSKFRNPDMYYLTCPTL